MEMKHVGVHTGSTGQASPTEYKNWERISDIEDTAGEMDISVKENVKSKKKNPDTKYPENHEHCEKP